MGAIAAVVLNLALWLSMFFLQNWEAGKERIAPRKKHNPLKPREGFLYMQDYHSTSWGDIIALSFIDLAVGNELAQGPFPSWWALAACIALSGIITAFFYWEIWLVPSHKPDWAFPKAKKVSFAGWLFLWYFYLQLAAAFLAFYFLVTGKLTWLQALVGLLGGGLYLLAMYLDAKGKRWIKLF